MNPVDAIVALKALGAQKPVNLVAVAEVLERVEGLVEEDIVGTYALGLISSHAIFEKLRSVEETDRMLAVSVAAHFGRLHAGTFLRHAVKDPYGNVAGLVRKHLNRLVLPDVAPPLRYEKGRASQWSARGWQHGIGDGYAARRSPNRVPPMRSMTELEAALGVREEDFKSIRRYVEFKVPKRKGGSRLLAAPHRPLKLMQRRLLDTLFSKLELHPASKAFSPGSSVVKNAEAHVGRAMVIKLDLQDFFPSIHGDRVSGLLRSMGMETRSSLEMARLLTYRPRLASGELAKVSVLPQGAPTSPVIANLIARRLDARLTGIAKKWSATYTRYADDLTFSFAKSPNRVGRFFWWVNSICQQEGFIENASKRRVMRSTGRQQVTGLVVNERVTLPRTVRRSFKAIIHNCEKHGVASQARGRPDFEHWLLGFAAWAATAQPDVGVDWLARVRKVLGR